MNRATVSATPALAAACDLRKAMSDKVVATSGAAYSRARRVLNGAVCRFPALFVRCTTTDDVRTTIAPISYGELLAMFDAHIVNGHHYAIQTRWLAEPSAATIAQLATVGGTKTSPLSLIALHHLHGAATRVPATATAFHLRR
jgi:hypothetical protein